MEYKKQYTPEGLDEAAYTIPLKLLAENKASYGLDSTGMRYPMDCFKAGAEWRDRQLNWARDLVQAGIDKPEEAVNILKRLKELL